jgi:cell division protein FtsL
MAQTNQEHKQDQVKRKEINKFYLKEKVCPTCLVFCLLVMAAGMVVGRGYLSPPIHGSKVVFK